MGIPSYYKNLIIKYNNIKTDINDINIDKLFIDYNGLIHPIAHITLCDNLSEVEAHNLLLLYKEQHPNSKIETQKYNYDFGGKHWGRDPDLH